MIELIGATRLLTDKEILDVFSKYFMKIGGNAEVLESTKKGYLNAIQVLSLITGHDENFVIDYIKEVIRRR
jgi:hypothetical protein